MFVTSKFLFQIFVPNVCYIQNFVRNVCYIHIFVPNACYIKYLFQIFVGNVCHTQTRGGSAYDRPRACQHQRPALWEAVRPVFVQPVYVQLFSSNPFRPILLGGLGGFSDNNFSDGKFSDTIFSDGKFSDTIFSTANFPTNKFSETTFSDNKFSVRHIFWQSKLFL